MSIELLTSLSELDELLNSDRALSQSEFERLVHDARAAHALHQLVNTPELVDFVKAVHLESVHQLDRWGTEDRTGKTPADWFWLVGYLAGRALEHHKEAERLAKQIDAATTPAVQEVFEKLIAHQREKAVHHCITTAAVCAHWHRTALGNFASIRAGELGAAAMAEKLTGVSSPISTTSGSTR